ncbi:MAG: ATP-binding cassette domain-containing protein, partial [Lachnospiraceae bacterium]|nr:ATP-binding cassette domain-containing protein [Lachnospiraceae bacterium]
NETDAQKLANLMIGHELAGSQYEKKTKSDGQTVLKLNEVKYHEHSKHNGLAGVSIEVKAGEIVGIAGVDGNGQTQLAQVVTGVISPEQGALEIKGEKISVSDPSAFIGRHVSHVPEDRNLQGLIGDMPISDNLILKLTDSAQFSRGKGMFLKKKEIRSYAENLTEKYDIR